MKRVQHRKARVGIFAIGIAAYWPQFKGLKERLERYQRQIEKAMRGFGCDLFSAGFVDDEKKAQRAGDYFCEQNVDIIFCYTATYATSSQVLPAVQRPNRPVVVLNIQPVASIDYEKATTGEWLAKLLGLLCPGNLLRLHPRQNSFQRGLRHARRGRTHVERNSRVD